MRPTGGDRRAWPVVLAWSLWLVTMLALAAVPWLDRLLRQAGRPDLVQLTPGTAFPIVATVSGATIGAVLASRKPRHPVGWLLLAVALSLTATAAAAQYLTWGLLVRPGALPGARWVSLYYSAIGYTAMTSIGLLLLVTPTGSLPSPAGAGGPGSWWPRGSCWWWWRRWPRGPWTRATRRSAGPSICAATAASCSSPIRSPWPSPRWPWWSRPGRWWVGSAGPAGWSASSSSGWPWPRWWW